MSKSGNSSSTNRTTVMQLAVRFFDPDGHLDELGESLASTAKRLYDQGMTTLEIAGAIGISEQESLVLLRRK